MQVDVPMERMPIANWLLIAFTVLFSLKVFADEAKANRKLLDAPAIDPAVEQKLQDRRLTEKQKQQIIQQELERLEKLQSFDESPVTRYALFPNREDFHLWQLITYQFVHGDFFHLLGNMLFLFCFGNAVNAKLGHALYLVLYLLLGAFAGLAYVVVSKDIPLIGASGAIAGITGVFLVLYPVNEIAVWTFRSMLYTGDAWRFPSWVFILFFMAWDLFGTLRLSGESGVAYVCHLGGEVLGISVAIGLVMARVVHSDRHEKNLPELWGWVPEEKPRRRKRRRRPPPPPPIDI
jgi:membrane associated rhomboid family serine protease